MIWALIISHLAFLALGVGIGRKHSKELTALRDEAEDYAAKCRAEAEEWRSKFEAIKKATKG